MKLRLIMFALIVGAGLTCGCDNGGKGPSWEQIKTLKEERTTLQMQVEQLQGENERLAGQVQTLSVLKPDVRLESLPEVGKIEVSKRTGLYDKDKDGKKETLIVYVCPYDKTGDAIKAGGQVQVKLLDLNAKAGRILLGQWEVAGAKLKESWAGTFMTNYYRLTFDVAEVLTGEEEELTVKVGFTDYIGGKVLTAQRVLKL